jgi:lipid II:glycine glycyltransferase (peptidoglycan interpeptide bridge formation enzyme)
MKQLDSSYTVEIDQIDKDAWHRLMAEFDDANFYQTWSYGASEWGEKNISHLVLRRDGDAVALAQARILKVPFFPIGTAYLKWGPMWKRRGKRHGLDDLRNTIRALYNEFVLHRRYLLKVIPRIVKSDETEAIIPLFSQEGYGRSEDNIETVVLDLNPPLEEIRKNLSKSWQRSLKEGEKGSLQIIEGSDDSMCETVINLAKEMKERKRYFGTDQARLLAAHKDLPESLKLKLMVCLHQGEPVAALGWQTIGKIGMGFVAGTGNKALELKASFVLWWKMIEFYKIRGFDAFDAAGVSQERNPGGYFFKTGLLGKNFRKPQRYIGQFDACNSALSETVFKHIYGLKDNYREVRRKMAKRKRKPESDQGAKSH